MRFQCRSAAVPAVFLIFGGIIAGCPMPDARLEEVVEIPCTNDVDCDDGNSCTHETCNVATSRCAISALDGVASPQVSKETCIERLCQNGSEVKIPVAMGLPAVPQIAGDCRKMICDGSGNHTTENDAADIPDDGNDCTADVCDGGVVKNSTLEIGTPCGPTGNLQCNGLGKCVGCTSDAQCSNGGNFCVIALCGANQSCETMPKSAGTELPTAAQIPQDCRRQICDDSGHIVEIFDPFDGQDDGNDCTEDVCNAGMPVYTPTAAGMTCGVGGEKICDGLGNCRTKTSDPCVTGLECATGFCVDGICCASSCGLSCMACNINGSVGTCKLLPFPTPDPSCSVNQVCNDSGVCKAANGRSCSSNTHCASGTCSGGVCKSVFGQPCTLNTECVSAMCVNNVCN